MPWEPTGVPAVAVRAASAGKLEHDFRRERALEVVREQISRGVRAGAGEEAAASGRGGGRRGASQPAAEAEGEGEACAEGSGDRAREADSEAGQSLTRVGTGRDCPV